MGEPLYRHKASSQGLKKIARLLAYWQLHKLARRHHNDGYPQMAIFSHDHIGHVINVDGRYEDDYLHAVFAWLTTFVKKMDEKIALDIGANIGNHALFFAKHFKSVHAFEPNPRTFELLKFNAAKAGNVVAHAKGLSDSEMSGTLHENPTNMGGTYIDLEVDGDKLDQQPIQLATLDTFANSHGLSNIALIKIDTEGFEARVLKGAQSVIEKNNPVIIFELSPSDFGEGGSSEVVNILSGKGYRFISVEKNFQLGKSRVGRYAGFLLRTLLGENYVLRSIRSFQPQFYQMVVAVHHSQFGT